MDEPLFLAFDVGNTRVKCAIVARETISRIFHIPTSPSETLATRLHDARENNERHLPSQCEAVVSSVCPSANSALREFWEETSATPITFLDNNIPLNTTVDQPGQIGTDRLLCALGARELVGNPAIVIMAGTAITVDLVDSKGRFAGGAICPGYNMCADALHRGTERLPRVDPRQAGVAVGKNTRSAILSGIHHFCRGGVLNLIADFNKQLSEKPVLTITGGDAKIMLPLHAGCEVVHRPHLIFEGIHAAWNTL